MEEDSLDRNRPATERYTGARLSQLQLHRLKLSCWSLVSVQFSEDVVVSDMLTEEEVKEAKKWDCDEISPPHGVVFIGKKKAKLSRNFYFDPFLLYLAFSRVSPRERHECKNLSWFLLVFAAPLRAWNAAWRPCFAKTFVPKNFPNKPCENKVPTTNRESQNLPWFLLVFAPPRYRVAPETPRGAHALQKFSRRKISRTNLAKTRFQQQTANPGTSHDFCLFLLPRFVLETPRGAHALQKLSCRKISRTNLARTKFQQQTANPRTYHDFCSFLLPRLVLETLRGAHALQKLSCRKISRTNLARTKFQQQTANPRTYHDFCSFLLPRLVLETLRGAHALQEFPRKKFSKNTFERTRFQQKSANAANLPWFLLPRFVLETLRGAKALLKFARPKFSQQTLGKTLQ